MFRGCCQLAKVQLSGNIRKIEAGMFRDCAALKMLRLPEKLEQIGIEAFAGCGALERLSIPESVREMGEGAFRGCAFETVHIPETVEELHWEMFSECRHLKNVYIPAGVKYIEADVFYGCDALKNVCFGADLAAMQAIRIGEGQRSTFKSGFALWDFEQAGDRRKVKRAGGTNNVPPALFVCQRFKNHTKPSLFCHNCPV